LLGGYPTGHANSGQNVLSNAPDKPSGADSRRVSAAEARRGPLTVTVREEPRDPLDCGFSGDALVLAVSHERRLVDSVSFCSAYGISRARHLTDQRGDHFILLEHGEGHGTGATSYYLTVYRLAGVSLDERARWLSEQSAGPSGASIYSYRVETPPGGGIIITGRWTLNGQNRADDPALSRQRTVVAIDTSPQTGPAT
jgi:hypothetical protein